MKQGTNTAAHIVLYSLSGLLVGCAVGGTLLYKIVTQDPPESSIIALPDIAAAASDTTDSTTETTTTTAVTLPPPDADSVRAIIQPAEELLTDTFSYTDSDRFENHSEFLGRRVPFTSAEVVLTYSGTVTMRIDADEIRYTVDNADKLIYVTLPEPEVVSHEIDRDSVRCYDVQNSLFSDSELNSYLVQLLQQKASVLARVSQTQRLPERMISQAERVIRSFLAASEPLSAYTVRFDEPEIPQETALPETTTEITTTPTTALPEPPPDDDPWSIFW